MVIFNNVYKKINLFMKLINLTKKIDGARYQGSYV